MDVREIAEGWLTAWKVVTACFFIGSDFIPSFFYTIYNWSMSRDGRRVCSWRSLRSFVTFVTFVRDVHHVHLWRSSPCVTAVTFVRDTCHVRPWHLSRWLVTFVTFIRDSCHGCSCLNKSCEITYRCIKNNKAGLPTKDRSWAFVGTVWQKRRYKRKFFEIIILFVGSMRFALSTLPLPWLGH